MCLKYYLFLLLIFSATSILAQENKASVFVTTSEDKNSTVWIKWIEPHLYSLNPSKVYRRIFGKTEWKLVTEKSIIMKDDLKLLEKSPITKKILEAMEDESPEGFDPILLLQMTTDAVKYNETADYLGLFHMDTTVSKGITYEYKIVNIVNGKEEIIGISNPIKNIPYQSEIMIQDVVVAIDSKIDTMIQVGWNGKDDTFFGANIWRREIESSEIEKINNEIVFPSIKNELPDGTLIFDDFFFADASNKIGNEYLFQVEGVNYFGQGSKKTLPIKIKFIDKSPAPLPEKFEVDLINRKDGIVYWTDISEKNLKDVNILMQHENGEFKKINSNPIPQKENSFNFTLKKYGAYTFKIQTISKLGIPNVTEIERTVEYKDIDPPVMPTNIQISADTGMAIISWNHNKESDLLGYIVFRGMNDDPSVPFQRIVTEPLKEPRYTNKLPKRAKSKFSYKICAVDTFLNMSPLTEPISIKLPDVIPPEAPVIKKANPSINQVTLEWLPYFEDDFESSEIYRQNLTAETPKWEILSIVKDENQLSFTDPATDPNTDYQYKIRASDDSGNWSEFSNTYNVRTKPDNTPAEGANKISTNYQKKKNQVTIKWKEDEPDRKGSVVFRKAEGSRLVALSPMINDKAVFVDKKITKGKTYTYLVKTYYNDGKVGASSPEELSISE